MTTLSAPHSVPLRAADLESLPPVDTTLRYVRVLEHMPDGQVSFEFSIGWPELAVELMLPKPAFEQFCRTNHVHRLESQA